MAPPAKRRRRNVVDASDDEHDQVAQPAQNTLTNFLLSSPSSPSQTRIPASSPSPSKNGTPTKRRVSTTSRASQSLKAGTSASPRKAKDSQSFDTSKTADLKTLFSKQAQRITTIRQPVKRTETVEDFIGDDISDDEISELRSSSASVVGQHAKKRQRDGVQLSQSEAPSASQRFLKPPKPPGSEVLGDDSRPWSERFGPRNLDELVVHKKKVSDVRRWLEEVLRGRLRQRVLILKGAAGAGKTTTVRLLAADMGCELLEWKNPAGSAGTGFVSASAKFDDFLGRGGKFGALDVDVANDPAPTPAPSASSSLPRDGCNRIMLVEEFPNTFSRSSSALSSFRRSILGYLASHMPSGSMFSSTAQKEPIQPLVMIISETLLTTTSASADSFTAHRLLGPEILGHQGVGTIEFNTVAPTLLEKALELIVQKEARKSGRRKTPGPLVLKRIGEIGDIRSAVSSLEWLCLKGDQDADWGAKVAFTKPKRSIKNGVGLTKGEEESLELVSQREASLGIFHAVGKVVYNKRDEESVTNGSEDLPGYLSMHSRPKRSQVSVDALIDETGTDTHTFISAIHENYILSCENTGPMDLSTPMDYVNECIEYLSLSDLLSSSKDVFFGGRGAFSGRDSASHVLRQDEITFETAVRGMLFSLPNPVKRKKNSTAKAADAFKMFYPASLKLWRAKEEIEGLTDHLATKLLKGEDTLPTKNLTDGAGAFRKPSQSGELSWMQRQQKQNAHQRQQSTQSIDSSGGKEETAPPLLSLGNAARHELLLERLPYMTHIARGRKSTAQLRDLEKVVSFQGVANGREEESDAEEDATPSDAWATDKPSEEPSPRKRSSGIKSGGVSGMLAQKLVLSDDDIEDD